MEWESVSATDRGLQRSNNEDALLDRRELGLFAVADGMGGHAAGEVASRVAIATVERELANASMDSDSAERVVRTFVLANREIRRRGRAEEDKRGMGTTLNVLIARPGAERAMIAHVGDSRAYRLRDGSFTRLTVDHTWVQERIDAGVLSPRSARNHPYASILTRVLGTEEAVVPDIAEIDVAPGDLFLLCTDGLTGMVPDAAIADILLADEPIATLADRLVAAAHAAGGEDNISLVLIRALPA